MSTFGKVLTVLVTLSLLGWIAMMSAVTELNKSWGQKVQQLDRDLAKLEQELVAQKTTRDQRITEISQAQVELNKDLTVFRARLSDAEKVNSYTREALTRVQFQATSAKAAAQSAEQDRDVRQRQKTETQRALADAQAKVEALKGEVDTQFKELAELRKHFRDLLKENTHYVQELRRREGRSAYAVAAPRR